MSTLSDFLSPTNGYGSLIGPAISGLTSIYGANQTANAAKDAAKTQAQASALARQDMLPWLQTGGAALGKLSSLLGLDPSHPFDPSTITNDPSYQFRLSQGLEALNRQLGAKGMLNSGNRLLETEKYGQGLASEEFNNIFNRLSGVAGTGQTAATNTGNLLTNQGNASAASQIAQSNAMNSGYAGLAQAISGYFKNQQDQSNLSNYGYPYRLS